MKVCMKFTGSQPVDMSYVDDDHIFGDWDDGSKHVEWWKSPVYNISASKYNLSENHEPSRET